jgi:hypothetical protein
VDGEDASEVRFQTITEMTILTVQLIVEFSKRLPGFDKLEREDQITLLKVGPFLFPLLIDSLSGVLSKHTL